MSTGILIRPGLHNCYLNSSFSYAKANSCAGGLASAGADLTWEEYIS